MAKKKMKFVAQYVPIDSLKPDPENPREISKRDMEELRKSVDGFKEMMEVRPLAFDKNRVVIGGNQRLAACKELGWKEVPAVDVSDWSQDKIDEFIVKDNLHSGQFKWGAAILRFGEDRLIKWGADTTGYVDEDEKNKEIEENQKKIDAMEVQFNEHHDYVVFLFDNANDYLKVISELGLKKVPTSLSPKTKTLGLGRVVDGKKLLNLLKPQK
jgi:hypothetical protein